MLAVLRERVKGSEFFICEPFYKRFFKGFARDALLRDNRMNVLGWCDIKCRVQRFCAAGRNLNVFNSCDFS